MRDFHVRAVEQRITAADAEAKIEVFAAEKELLVPAAGFPEDAPGQQERRAHQDIDRADGLRVETLTAIAVIHPFEQAGPTQDAVAMQEGQDARPGTIGNLRQPLPVEQ